MKQGGADLLSSDLVRVVVSGQRTVQAQTHGAITVTTRCNMATPPPVRQPHREGGTTHPVCLPNPVLFLKKLYLREREGTCEQGEGQRDRERIVKQTPR